MLSGRRVSGFGGPALVGFVFLVMASTMVIRARTEKHPIGRNIFYFMALLPTIAGSGMWWMCLSRVMAEWRRDSTGIGLVKLIHGALCAFGHERLYRGDGFFCNFFEQKFLGRGEG